MRIAFKIDQDYYRIVSKETFNGYAHSRPGFIRLDISEKLINYIKRGGQKEKH